MSTLYIIGNGFDLHHGLPTSLTDFRKYAEYSAFSRLYEDGAFMICANQTLDEHWESLEENLSNFDVDALIERAAEYYDDNPHENQFVYEVESAIDVLTTGLKRGLSKYLSLAESQDIGIDKLLKIDTNARFLCFNYTNTLDRIYKVPSNRICYIHGKLNTPNAPIVIGHCMEDSGYTPQDEIDISTLTEEALAAYEDSYSPDYEYAVKEAHGYFKKNYKDTVACINASSEFFESLSDIDRVIILGHSLGGIDLPYFECINRTVRGDCHWAATYYQNDQKRKIFERLEGIVNDRSRMSLFEISQLVR